MAGWCLFVCVIYVVLSSNGTGVKFSAEQA